MMELLEFGTVVGGVVVGIADGPADPASVERADLVLGVGCTGSRVDIQVADLDAALTGIEAAVHRNPLATARLCALLRAQQGLSVADGLVAESLEYSALLGLSEFARWRASKPVREIPAPSASPVLIARVGDELHVVMNRPERRNAYGVAIRDGLAEALDLAIVDDTITTVVLRGNGPNFCSGGDLDEFGSNRDPISAHEIRMDRSAARRIHSIRDRVRVELHGTCVGAGIEIASFCGHVAARNGTSIVLPELEMGLVPGAGGTVGIARRIGRHRTAYLVLSGIHLDASTALTWGLVDEVIDD